MDLDGMNKRIKILEKASEIVCNDREDTYGSPEDSFSVIADLWTAYLDMRVRPEDVASMMILLKIARTRTGKPKEDNYIDIAGYAACGAEIALKRVCEADE